ncbi:MAG TPA: hypothetical protein VKA32_08225 [Gammaproteobacteria bacterium]|nr:hypothetical protein [Gammaproteobacteria bacterium]
MTESPEEKRQRRRVIVTAILLGLVAMGFYVAFIVVQAGRS